MSFCTTTDVRKLKHFWRALLVLLSELTAKGKFTFSMTKLGKELHLFTCAASVSNEGFRCCCNINRKNYIHELDLDILQLTPHYPGRDLIAQQKQAMRKKNFPGSANLTRFCWIMLNLVPVTPPAFYVWEGHTAWDMNAVKPQSTLKNNSHCGLHNFQQEIHT